MPGAPIALWHGHNSANAVGDKRHILATATIWWGSGALASLPGQTPSTFRVAPEPETRTLAKPNARNFLAISSLSANRSTDFSERGARQRLPCSTVNSPARLEALTKLAAMAKAASTFGNLRAIL